MAEYGDRVPKAWEKKQKCQFLASCSELVSCDHQEAKWGSGIPIVLDLSILSLFPTAITAITSVREKTAKNNKNGQEDSF